MIAVFEDMVGYVKDVLFRKNLTIREQTPEEMCWRKCLVHCLGWRGVSAFIMYVWSVQSPSCSGCDAVAYTSVLKRFVFRISVLIESMPTSSAV